MRQINQKKNPRSFLYSVKHVPKHVAFIMDGNRRFAQRMGKESAWGHSMGVETVKNILHWTYLSKVKYITIYAFSTENFKREASEIDSIFSLLEKMLLKLSNDPKIRSKGIKIQMIGETNYLPPKTLEILKELEKKTRRHEKMCLNIALAYGGQDDIAQAFEKIAASNAFNKPYDEFISNDEISKHLFPFSNETVPDVDLLIRTGDEHRTSNFLPWQANGNNAFVCYYKKTWPEFTFKDLYYILRKYQSAEEKRKKTEEKRRRDIEKVLENKNE